MHVTLEPLSAAHLDGAAELWADGAVIRYTAIPVPLDRTAAAARLETLLVCQRDLPGSTVFAVLEEGTFQGIAGSIPTGEGFGFFYQLLPRAWGRGVGQRAARMALEALLRRFPETEVLADAAAENTACIRILEKLGFRRTSVQTGGLHREGRYMDIWKYVRSPGGKQEGM